MAIQTINTGTTANDGTGDPLRSGATKINANFTDHETRLATIEGLGALNYRGTWNANSNTPTLTSGSGTKGYLYKVGTAGSTALDGTNTWYVGDYLLFNGTTWDRLDGGATEVVSVAGRTGAITLTSTDIGDFTEASQDVIGAMIAAAGGAYNDAANTITLPSGSTPAALTYLSGAFTTPEEYGAVGDGTTDDTTAFNNALASGKAVIMSNKRYSVANINMPNNGRLFGMSGPSYTGDTPAGITRPWLVARSGATSIINVDGKSRYICQDFALHGNGIGGVAGFSGGGTFGFMKNLAIINCATGYGGYGSVTGTYTGVLQAISVVCGGCTTGIASLVDSAVIGGAVAGGSGNGVDFSPGADSNNFIGLRNEWNGGVGYSFFQCGDNQVMGGMVDRCGQAGLRANGLSGPLSVTNVDFRRNGSSSTSDGTVSTHMTFLDNSGAKARIVINGCTTSTGTDDGGGGLLTPRNSVNWTGTNSFITVSGCDLSGFVTSVYNGTAPSGLVIGATRTA